MLFKLVKSPAFVLALFGAVIGGVLLYGYLPVVLAAWQIREIRFQQTTCLDRLLESREVSSGAFATCIVEPMGTCIDEASFLTCQLGLAFNLNRHARLNGFPQVDEEGIARLDRVRGHCNSLSAREARAQCWHTYAFGEYGMRLESVVGTLRMP